MDNEHSQRALDVLVDRVKKQRNAISLALMALDKLTPNDTMGDHARLAEAKTFLREALE